jgi:hypothetical protein
VSSRPRTENMHPGTYRGVSVTRVDCALDETALREHFVGRSAYFKTRFAVVHSGGADVCILRIHTLGGADTADDTELFVPIAGVTMLAAPGETAMVRAPDVDTGIPTQLACAARDLAPGRRAVVVHGRYEHVSFIIDPQPVRLRVRDVVPPSPAKLVDQVTRVLDVREDLPPIEVVPEVVDLVDLAAAHPAGHYALPCRGSGFESDTAEVSFLDEHPERRDWVLIGCTRSQQIHRAFYGDDVESVTLCPLERPVTADLVLAKCCLQDDALQWGPNWVSVPWGASLRRVSEALDRIAELSEVAWQPA